MSLESDEKLVAELVNRHIACGCGQAGCMQTQLNATRALREAIRVTRDRTLEEAAKFCDDTASTVAGLSYVNALSNDPKAEAFDASLRTLEEVAAELRRMSVESQEGSK